MQMLNVNLCIALMSLGVAVCQETPNVSVPTYLEIEEARKLNVTCEVTNAANFPNATMSFRWTKLEDASWELLQPTFVITEVVTEDAGNYRCEVAMVNPVGTGQAYMELVILYFARWVFPKIPKFAGNYGDNVRLECYVHAQPAPSFYWQFKGANISFQQAGRKAENQEYYSFLDVNGVSEESYGDYICHGVNQQGDRPFTVQLLKPGKPDLPQECNLGNVTAHNASVYCLPGYTGGEPLKFSVFKESSHHERMEADFTHTADSDGWAMLFVSRLEPNTSWTLLIFQTNVHGRSDEALAVSVQTKDGPPLPPEDTFPTELVIIITGSCLGALIVIILITVIACVVVKRSSKSDDQRPTLENQTKRKDAGAYVMEEHDNSANLSREDSHRFNRQNSWGSFKRKKPVKALSGMTNPNYAGSSHSVNQPRPVDYDGQGPPYVINLRHGPGESSDYDNVGYVQDLQISRHGSQETSFTHGSDLASPGNDPEVILRRQLADPTDRASRLSKGQPSLAGMGALSFLPDPGRPRVSRPLSPSVTPTRSPSGPNFPNVDDKISLHMNRPSFVPEVPWEFPRQKLYIRNRVGEGDFGEVWRAQAEGILGRPDMQAVAVKMPKEHFTAEEKRALLKELGVLKVLQPHPNVIQLLGCCSTTDPICIILELAENGSLCDMLRRQRSAFEMNDLSNPETGQKRNINFKLRDFTIFGLHVASGMEYISSQQLLHRDLAARRVLVDEHMICKVGDFGSARDVTETRHYQSKTQGRLPVRWMAPESLIQGLYSVDSDVWSFGILLWEIYTIGSTPYPGMSCADVQQFVQKGCRMAKPQHCSEAMYAIMKDCWSQFPPKRPSFSILRHRLTAILDEPNANLYVDQLEDNVYEILADQAGEKC